jgi:hypothetical protein
MIKFFPPFLLHLSSLISPPTTLFLTSQIKKHFVSRQGVLYLYQYNQDKKNAFNAFVVGMRLFKELSNFY